MSGLSTSWVDAIGWMLLHSLWQGAAVATALALALRLLLRAPAQARYLAACVAMVLMIALPAAVVWRPRAIPSVADIPHAMDPQPPRDGEPADPEVYSTLPPRPWQTRIVPIFPTIVGLWMAGAGIFSVRLFGGWVLARRWVRRDTRPLVCPWIDRLKKRLGIRHAVAFLESAHVEVPMVVGWLRPAILVPVAALSGLTAPELEAILTHELAHIRRHDYLVNMLQCLVEVLMFYHPATWWITRVIRREREHCCDDMAVAASGDRLTYARALAAMEGLRAPAFSLSPAANGGNLLARVRRILKPQEEESMKPVCMFVGLVVVLAVAPIWLAQADDKTTKADPGTARPTLNRNWGAAGVRAEVETWKAFLPIAQIKALTTGPIIIDPLPCPNRSFADILTSVEEAPTGRFMIDPGTQPVESQPERPVVVLPDNSGVTDDALSEAEVLAKIPQPSKGNPPDREVHRNNIRITVEKTVDRTDPAKDYPLAGHCQLVHRHYKCTVYYDELSRGDHPVPFHHVDHKIEVVYIGKDFLRRAPKPGQPAKKDLDDQIDRVSREIEQLKHKFQLDRLEQERVLDRLIKELEGLKKHHNPEKIDDAEAEKTFGTGMYYKRIGKVASAEFYFGKVLQRWPNSPWAVKAKAQQAQADPKPSDRTRVQSFNFLAGGFY